MLTAVRKLLDLLSRRAKVQLVVLLILLMASAILEAVGIASILPFIALVIDPGTIQSNHWLSSLYNMLGFSSNRAFLSFIGTIVLVLLVLTNAAKALTGWLTLRYQSRQYFELGWRLLASYMVRPYAFFLGRNTAELSGTILHEAHGVVERVLRPVIDIISNTAAGLAILSILMAVDPVVAMVIFVVMGGAYGGIYLLVHRMLRDIGIQQVEANAQKFRSASEAMSGIKDLKVLGRELTFLKKYAFFAERHSKNTAASGVVYALPRNALEVVAFGGILLAVLYLVNSGHQAAQIVPVLALYAFAGYRLLPMLHTLFSAFAILRFNMAALETVHTELTTGPYSSFQAEKELRSKALAPPAVFNDSLELRNVIFKYETATEPSVRSLNLTIYPNTSVGLVGQTGCGKTTTVDLILGLLEPTAGSILLDGVEITEYNRANWQKLLGYVPQNIYISDDTVTRNIAFGVPDSEIDMDAVRRAAEIANLAEVVETSLPEGYDTYIGERGVRLSGGQRQRIGIARAMYRDPAILVMDEATSALDGITEDSVMRAVQRLSKRKTIILIAHRLSTVRDCDVIYQLDQGTVVASGTYEEMLRKSSWFREAAGSGLSS